jgi:PhnB protein
MLYMKDLSAAIEFYKKAFGALERWRVSNPDGTTHVAELYIPPVVFRLHEEADRDRVPDSAIVRVTTVVTHLLVHNPDDLMANAVAAGATVISPMRDYEYGYRQGTFRDPSGHHWCLEKFDGVLKVPTM